MLAIVGLLATAGCDGARPLGAGSGGVAPPIGTDQSEAESPNSLPVGSTTSMPMATDTGVVGVMHLPPTP